QKKLASLLNCARIAPKNLPRIMRGSLRPGIPAGPGDYKRSYDAYRSQGLGFRFPSVIRPRRPHWRAAPANIARLERQACLDAHPDVVAVLDVVAVAHEIDLTGVQWIDLAGPGIDHVIVGVLAARRAGGAGREIDAGLGEADHVLGVPHQLGEAG